MAGWEVTLEDFEQLVRYPGYQKVTAALLKEWFGYRIEGRDGNAVVRSSAGEIVDIVALHHAIQSAPDKQQTLYRQAMTLWR